jgi:endonuclease/exonuclease/phosphatase family metal-dependent hydrolase
VPLVVRTWNLFHGNAVPPQRRAFLREMVELISADEPAVVCLQEIPLWALPFLDHWSGMQAVGAVARPPRLPSIALSRWLTALNHGLLRSAVTGQANAILVAPHVAIDAERTLVVSRSGERRICHSLRLDGRIAVVNFHITGGAAADDQLRAVAEFAEAEDVEATILGGDANLRPEDDGGYRLLRERGFSEPLPASIDQIIVRGLPSSPPFAWPEERRRVDGRLLSDHAPVELTAG